jgi:hypothetical protein
LQVVRHFRSGLKCNYFYDLQAILGQGQSKLRYFWTLYLI